VVLGDDEDITAEFLGFSQSGGESLVEGENLPYHEALERYSRHILEQALRRTGWSQTKAADLLHLQRTYLSRLLKQKNIQHPSSEN
jgi:DNA-binding NtrC family response regulator